MSAIVRSSVIRPLVRNIVRSDGAPSRPPIAFTSVALGDWDNPATWDDGVETPVAGDTVTINHAVTITANAAVGAGTADVDCITIGDNGTLDLNTSVTLDYRGDIFATGAITLAAGGKLHANTAGLSKIEIRPGTTAACITCNGTAGNHCEVKAVGAGAMYSANLTFFTGGGRFVATYTDFARFGDETQIDAMPYNQVDYTGGDFVMTDCTFDQFYGIFHNDSLTDQHPTSTGAVKFIRCKWTNSVTPASPPSLWANFVTFSNPGMLCEFTRCDFDKIVKLSHPDDWLIQDCVFRDGVLRYTDNVFLEGTLGDFLRNFVRSENDAATLAFAYGDTITDCVFVTDNEDTNNHQGDIESGTGTCSITGCVWWWTGTTTSPNPEPDGFAPKAPSSGTRAANPIIVSRCLILPNGNGIDSDDNISATGASYATTDANHTIEFDRCTIVGGRTTGGILMGETFVTAAGALKSCKNCLFVGTTKSTPDMHKINFTVGGLPDDVFLAEDVDYNGSYRIATGTAHGPGSGKGYGAFTFSGSDVVGDNDVDDVDPAFVDDTRTPATWAGTLTAAMDRLAPENVATYDMADLLDYLKAGWEPTAAAFNGAGEGGVDIGWVDFTP